MRIGILTYHSVYNFGANLQILSTIGYLKNNGLDPIVINWIPEDLEARYDRTILTTQADVHKEFIKEFIPCSRICRTDKDIVQIINEEQISGIIVGSDAVLQARTLLSRIHFTKRGIKIEKKIGSDTLFPNPFWGSFIPELKRKIPIVLMSASSQNSAFKYIRGSLKNKMKKSLSQFDLITVRDNWTKRMINYLTDKKNTPSITPDPVFAFNQNIKNQFTKKEILEKFNLPEKYILISFSSNRVVSFAWMKSLESIAKEYNLKCVALTMPGGVKFKHPFSKIIEPPLDPREWYSLIKFSNGYIGELMHAAVVALHNSVPFFSFDPYGIINLKYFVNNKSSKIYDLMKFAGFLGNRVSTLGRGYKYPSPADVIYQITEFNFEKCNIFSINQTESYNRMMKSITNILFK